MKEHINVLGIDIATNGTILSDKFAEKLNEFSLYIHDYIENNRRLNNILRSAFLNEKKITVFLRISNSYHNNEPQKSYDFYSKRMPNVIVEIMEGNMEDDAKRIPLKMHTEGKAIAYSGRAKNLKSNFYCDSPHHKIVYETKTNSCVKCPILVDTKGNFSISATCSRKLRNENIFGNVFEKRSLREMITDWNYKTPLTCNEACNLETIKMGYETNRVSEISEVLGKNISNVELKEIIEKNSILYSGIENYRRKLHEKEPSLTSEEIEQASNYWIEFEKAKANEKSEKEIEDKNNTYINYLTQCVYDHYFDGVEEVHKEFPYLSSNECKEMKECYIMCAEKNCNIYYYALKAQTLMMKNESRLRSAIIEEYENDK